MSEMIYRFQLQTKKASVDFATYVFRVITGGWISLIFAHFFQYIFGFENFLFFMVMVMFTAAIVRISKGWGPISIVIFNLFCVLVLVLIQLYLKTAPGA